MNEIARKPSLPRCTLCGKATEPAFKPFCSKHCADIDLNRWLSGVYAVPVKEDKDEDGERPDEGDAGVKPWAGKPIGRTGCSPRSSVPTFARSVMCPMPAMP